MAQNKFRKVAGPRWSTCIICQLPLEDFWCSDNIAVKYTWNNSFLNCGCRCKWRMIIAWKKIRASTWFEPVTSALPVRCSTNWAMNFMYTSHHFTPHGRYELSKLTSLPMCGFIAQLVEQRTGNAEVTGSNPVEALIFSGFFFPVALQNYCDDHSSLSVIVLLGCFCVFISYTQCKAILTFLDQALLEIGLEQTFLFPSFSGKCLS